MSSSSNISLGALRLQVRQRSDMENNQAVTDPELNNYITNSYKELYDLLIAAYGNDYYIATPYQFTIGNAQIYPLPDGTGSFLSSNGSIAPKFYKLSGVDLQYSASPTGWVTLKNFEWIERNKYAYPNTTSNFAGYTNIKYRIQSNNLYFIPIPAFSQLVQAWYAPAPTSLQFIPVGSTTSGSPLVTVPDVTGMAVGMNVYGTINNAYATILSINTATNVLTLSSNSLATSAATVLQIWSDATTIDGISGWEEYVIVDAAIKVQIKQEGAVDELKSQKKDMYDRIVSMTEGRDMGQAAHVSDAMSINGFGSEGFGDGWGGMGSF